MDYGVVSNMRYYRDLNGDYYYLDTSGRRIYVDNIVEKEAPESVVSSTTGANIIAYTFVNVKALLYDMLQKLLPHNQIG